MVNCFVAASLQLLSRFCFAVAVVPRWSALPYLNMSDDENVLCLACHKNVAEGTNSMKCGECGNVYHCGKCSGVTKNKLKAMSAEDCQAWRCTTCHAAEGRQSRGENDDSLTPQATQMGANDTLKLLVQQGAESLARITQMLERIVAIETQLSAQTTKQENIQQTLEEQNKTLGGFEVCQIFVRKI